MTSIFKSFFELGTSQLSISDNPVTDYIGMAIILYIAFKLAFSFVGDLYNADIIHSKLAGSAIHWAIRIGLVYLFVQLIIALF